MEGAARAAKREYDLAITQAWHTAIFALNGYAGKLTGKRLSDYLSDGKGARKPSDAAAAIAFFHALKARGLPVEIKRVVH